MTAAESAEERSATTWLLLIHQIPPKPDYLRVKIGRRLQRVGAVAIKNSVYVLPDRSQSVEDLQWVRAEIVEAGGEAFILKAAFVDGLSTDDVVALFQSARDGDYGQLAAEIRETWSDVRRRERKGGPGRPVRMDEEIVRLRKRFASIGEIDFFNAPGKVAVRDALLALSERHERAIQRTAERSSATQTVALDRAEYRARTWVTREGIFVDRMASAWLIRRFIDRDAKFRFVPEESPTVRPSEIRFDMYEGEFTHVGDRCTFETLLHEFALNDGALGTIAEIVHDIDLKDAKFSRDEAAGIERLLAGAAQAHGTDSARLERASQVFDDLYAVFGGR